MGELNLKRLLGHYKKKSIKFSDFIAKFVEDPIGSTHTSSSLISEAIKHFGFEIVVRSGQPTISYHIFKDPFSNGTNAVFGQEFCIKQIVDVIESVGKESGPNRGIVLVGPPASGKTNIIDLISIALEEYTKQANIKLYSFYFTFDPPDGPTVEFRPSFMRNPLLAIPTSLQQGRETTHPRQELFEYINSTRPEDKAIVFPTFYQNASLDKQSLDIIESLSENPRNSGKSLYDILEEYVRVEEIEFSNAQAKGIANIDDMRQLKVIVRPADIGGEHRAIVDQHLPGAGLRQYQGAMVAANRGLLHIHDAFGVGGTAGPNEDEYKPLLMLLGSGKASIESTQTAIDTTVTITTNIEEMALLDRQLTSSKLLDRIEKIPVNYLLDANSEMDILRRDMSNMREKYDVDPNLLKIASFFSVLTRLLPPVKAPALNNWPAAKKRLYMSIAPEQKLFIYASQPEDPVATINNLPHWHLFRNEMIKLGIDLGDSERISSLIACHDSRISLDQTGVFSAEQRKMIDDEFMRDIWNEHYPNEGKHGISVRQLQNIMRDTIANSDGFRVHVGTFFSQLKKLFVGGPSLHRWLGIDPKYKNERDPIPMRFIGDVRFAEGEGDYGDFRGLAKVAQAIYYNMIQREITVATVNRDSEEIALDLRRYLQHALLAKAVANQAFAHIMIPRFTFVDPGSGIKIDRPDNNYLSSIERILAPNRDPVAFRMEMAQRFLDMQASGELRLEEGRSLVSSQKDNLLSCFGSEYSRLLSHRKTVGEIDAEQLSDAFFHKKRSSDRYDKYSEKVRALVENILSNMGKRFGYSEAGALDTILYALRKNIINFIDIIS